MAAQLPRQPIGIEGRAAFLDGNIPASRARKRAVRRFRLKGNASVIR